MDFGRKEHCCLSVKANRSRAPASQSGSPLASCTFESYQHPRTFAASATNNHNLRFTARYLAVGIHDITLRPD